MSRFDWSTFGSAETTSGSAFLHDSNWHRNHANYPASIFNPETHKGYWGWVALHKTAISEQVLQLSALELNIYGNPITTIAESTSEKGADALSTQGKNLTGQFWFHGFDSESNPLITPHFFSVSGAGSGSKANVIVRSAAYAVGLSECSVNVSVKYIASRSPYSEGDWSGTVTLDEMPTTANPSTGMFTVTVQAWEAPDDVVSVSIANW